MLTVTSLTGETELLTNIKNCEVNEEVNGDFSISFASFLSENNAHSYPLLEQESIVELDGHEFRVLKLIEVRNRKEVQAQHIFFDLIGHQVYGYIGGTKNANDIFSFILAGSGWTFENVDVTKYIVLSNFGENNAIKLIRDACNALDCEIKIKPGKHIKLYQRIGTDTDNQFRFGHNIKTLRKSVDTTNLFTVIKGFGANGLEVTYTSPNASIYSERHAEPIRDDRYTQADSLLDRLKQELNDAPEISYDIELTQLDFDVHLGDKFWTIYEPLNMDIKTRISAMKWFPFSNRSPVVTVENRKKTFTDILTQQKVEIDENKKEYRSRFDQTNERITMEVEAVNQSIAQISIEADNIRLSVEELENSIAAIDIRADNIVMSVQDLGNRVDSAEASISIQSGLISSKVSQNGVISAINQSAEVIDIDASRINLKGITNVNETLYIGDAWRDSTYKSIEFRGYLGGVGISSPMLDNMSIYAINYIEIDTHTLDFSHVQNVVGLTVSNADYAETANNAYHFGGYSPNNYVTSYSGSAMSIQMSGSTMVLRIGGNSYHFVADATF